MADLIWNVNLLSKIESSYGVDPTPVGGDAIETRNLQITRYDGQRVTNEIDRPTLGGYSETNIGPRSGVTFNVGMQGSGAAGTAPAFGRLLRAAGFAETINASTSVQYDPVSTGYESVTAYHFMSGMLQKITGARANLTGQIGRAVLPIFGFNLQGLYNRPSTPAPITPDISDFFDPIAVTKINTPTINIDGFTGAKLDQFSFDMGQVLSYLNTTNYEGIDITQRAVTGQLSIFAPDLATKDFFADMVESHNGVQTGVFQLVHGNAAGKIVQIDAPKIQLTTIADSNNERRGIYTFGVSFLPVSGNDEIRLTFS